MPPSAELATARTVAKLSLTVHSADCPAHRKLLFEHGLGLTLSTLTLTQIEQTVRSITIEQLNFPKLTNDSHDFSNL
jgi:hypothetical protein